MVNTWGHSYIGEISVRLIESVRQTQARCLQPNNTLRNKPLDYDG